jgi:acetyltransferase EpsM
MAGSIIMLGGGGHALVVAEAARLAGCPPAGVFDDARETAVTRRLSLPWLGTISEAARERAPLVPLVLAIGDLATRRRILDAPPPGLRAGPAVIHPSATVSPTATIGPGAYIGPRAVVHAFAVIGAHATINTGSIVEHECEIGENAHIAPGAVLGGRVRIGADTLIGLGARVLPNLSVGAGATIGGGAVVVRDLPGGVTAVGVPARPSLR